MVAWLQVCSLSVGDVVNLSGIALLLRIIFCNLGIS